jgi:glucose-6-phosphate 1-dehydrogenase
VGTRILVEKPFGKDLNTAEKLDELFGKLFKEEQIYRIDHYLAKDSIMDLVRKHDKTKWNKNFIEKVELNLFEEKVVGSRGAMYDSLGALRDVGQNHLLQMLAMIAMPLSKEELNSSNLNLGRDFQKARAEVLNKLMSKGTFDIVKAQYDGYKQEAEVNPESKTETFFRITAHLNIPEWDGVPFVLSSGKALDKSVIEVVLHFKDKTKQVINIPNTDSLKAYQKILLDCIAGDQTVFASTEEIFAEWKFISPIIENWKNLEPVIYKIGSKPEEI